MINWKSMLSSFNDKPTLLEWLKLVEKALKESVLTNVLTDTKDGKTAFTFKFEDGTEITTDYVQTQGPQGPIGEIGATGATGPQGVSVTGVEEVCEHVEGNQTVTTIRINYSNGTSNEIPIYAENGNVKLYMHNISLNAINIENLPELQIKYVSTNSDKITTFAEINEIVDKSISMLSIGIDSETVPPLRYSVADARLILSGPHNGEFSVDVFTSYPYSYTSTANYFFEPPNTKIEDKVEVL